MLRRNASAFVAAGSSVGLQWHSTNQTARLAIGFVMQVAILLSVLLLLLLLLLLSTCFRWAGGTNAATDFSAIAFQIKLLGYNAIRLPFTHGNLANTNVWDLVRDCERMSRPDFTKRIVDPDVWAQQNGQLRALPGNPAFQSNNPPTQCNTYLPSNSNRYMLIGSKHWRCSGAATRPDPSRAQISLLRLMLYVWSKCTEMMVVKAKATSAAVAG
jgi:hypothetical protein